MQKIRLGILGTGSIVKRVMTDMHNCKQIELTAIASRTPERAKEAAALYGIPNAFGSYQAMAESDLVDLVYIASPHQVHCEHAMLMMNHGKHVICEKPITHFAAQTAQMIECARQNHVFLMEAMWTRFMPAMVEAMRLIRAGEIGTVDHIYGDFGCTYPKADPRIRLFCTEMAGGALLDIGVYPLMAITGLFGWEPQTVQAVAKLTPSGCDLRTAVQLQYASGESAHLMCSFDALGGNDLYLYGTKGYIHIPYFWHAERFTLCLDEKPPQEFTFAHETEGHHYQFDHAAECILQGLTESPVVPLAESMAVSEICTRIRHSVGVFYEGEEKDS